MAESKPYEITKMSNNRSLKWKYYTRNQDYVEKRVKKGKYDCVSTTGWGNFDGFFGFLLKLGFFSLFDFRPEKRQRIMIPLIKLLSTYSLKVILSLSSLNQISNQLFKEKSLLKYIGFTGRELTKGFSKRSKGKQLPFHITTLGKMLKDLSLEEINKIFSIFFALLAKCHFIPKGTYAVDATDLSVEEKSKYENKGHTYRMKKNKSGYRLISIRYVGEKGPEIFVAAILFPINENESKYLLPLIEQAQRNIGKDKIKLIVMDRIFLGGNKLWDLKHEYGIDFLIYSKSNMDVTDEMKKRGEEVKKRQEKGLPLDEDTFIEKDKEFSAIGFNHLSWFWTYGDEEHNKKWKRLQYKKEKKSRTNYISGVLITKYKGKERQPGKEITLLSNRKISKKRTPLFLVFLYRRRQGIENQGFRELKQGWHLGKFPGKSFSAVLFHTLITLMLYDAAACYKTEKGERLSDMGIRALREKEIGPFYGVIVYIGNYFGVFDLEEFLYLIGKPPTEFINFRPP